ncbi:YbhB/YbcL family Raf kinase inhibitor-like protein [Nocardioides sp. AN3]
MKVNLGELSLESPDFLHGGRLPATTSGEAGVLPTLRWSGVPGDITSFAVIVEDRDAPLIDGFVHWVAYGVPASARGLGATEQDAYGLGVTDMGTRAFVPVGPPPGHGDHYYHFHLYAIAGEPPVRPGMSAAELRAVISEYVVAQARIVGVFGGEA